MSLNVTESLVYLISKYVGDRADAQILLEKLENPNVSAKYFLVEVQKRVDELDEEDLALVKEISFYSI